MSNIEDDPLMHLYPKSHRSDTIPLCLFILSFALGLFLFTNVCRAERRRSAETGPENPDSQKVTRPLGFYEYKFYKSFGSYGLLGRDNFENPVDIGIDNDDDIYVLDRGRGRIQRFDSEGDYEHEWDGIELSDEDRFIESTSMDSPNAIYVDYKERIGQTVIYVADTKNNRILQFNRDGKLINPEGDEIEDINEWEKMVNSNNLLWGKFGSRDGQFHNPSDIAVDGHDNCYVLDARNSRIQCFDDRGEFKSAWGGFGSGPGSFLRPTRIAYDGTKFGSIWVIDSKTAKLHQFDLDGDFIRAIIPKDKDASPLPSPSDLCIDSQGFIYIADSDLNKVFKYNNDLEFVQCWGEEGSGPGQFKRPMGICVDTDNRVLVVDSGNSRIQVFRHF